MSSVDSPQKLSIEFCRKLSEQDQNTYQDILFKLALFVNPTLEPEQTKVRINSEIKDFCNDPTARFIIIRRDEEIDAIATLLEHYTCFQISQLAVTHTKDYSNMIKMIVRYVAVEYPNQPLWVVVRNTNKIAVDTFKELGREINIELNPKRTAKDGWITYCM